MSYRYKDMTIINPLMRGGIVPREVREKIFTEGWTEVGYCLCFDCIEGRSGLISKPGVKGFLEEVARFFGGDAAQHTFGCRGAQFAAMHSIAKYAQEQGISKTVIADPNCHYTTIVTAEMCGLSVVEPPHTGHPEYKVTVEEFAKKIDAVKKSTGKPALVVLTHADPSHGNLAPAEEVGKLCEEEEIPFLLNAAYTGGVMPINMKELKADFLTLSAHKSMASLAPLGFLVTNFEWSKRAFEFSKAKTDWTGRTFGKKIPGIFGCSIGGIPLVSAMLSFPHVKERVRHWDEEMAKSERFVKAMEDLGDLMLLGERPHRHHLLHFETPLFWEISKGQKKGGFFLADEMTKRGVVGLHKGLSKHVKLSVYGLSDDEVKKVLWAFGEVAKMPKAAAPA